jgi:hypothetical protein
VFAYLITMLTRPWDVIRFLGTRGDAGLPSERGAVYLASSASILQQKRLFYFARKICAIETASFGEIS